jgi:1-acyl-sn-glycerol-3-phosphate acyltransferase
MSDWFYFTARKAIRLAYRVTNHKINIEGEIPKKPTVLTVNHYHRIKLLFSGQEKWADHLLLGFLPVGKIHFAVQNKQYMKPTTRFCLERLETFSTKPIDVRKGIDYVRKGEIVAIFPQGEAHRMYENRYYKGAAFIAKKGNVDITPINVGSYSKKNLYLRILPPINTKDKSLEQITQEIKIIYSG